MLMVQEKADLPNVEYYFPVLDAELSLNFF